MSLVEVNWQPADRQLRQFGLVCFIALPMVAWIWGASALWIGILAAVAALIAIGGFVAPQLLKPIFLALMIITIPIGMVVGELAMMFIYFLVFLPLGLVMRMAGRDALQLRIKKETSSYWETKKKPKSAASYYQQS
ncbi:MAG: hypothetical protein AAF483_16215 [Planctomycetota bacterium]